MPLTRRTLLLAASALPLASLTRANPANTTPEQALAALEQQFDGRLGVLAIHTGTGAKLAHRADERFPLCSTFKFTLAAAILHRSVHQPDLLAKRIRYEKDDLVTYSPITEKHLSKGMTIAELCAATVQYSDNAAANLLLEWVNGPAGLTAWARTVGDAVFRLDRWETELNSALPGDERDTTTPAAMAHSLHALVLGDVLPAAQRTQLQDWLRGNTTGGTRIRAGMPADWTVGDKTGTGDYGSTNDVGVIWRPKQPPIALAIYLTQRQADATARNDIVAAAAAIVAAWAGQGAESVVAG
ncbi:class A beta-lactamase [Chitinimonas sp. BJYL2]|uniref:class A beta-lactamase n=1 Tax=Chitinimonas sp. BJYL2 TaxID=2976696 RepID=UPI0022B5241C|nr:class A beta-lactamase [Chitinimonas sp. BJYL2]